MVVAFGSGPTYADASGNIYVAGKYAFGSPELSPPMYQRIFGSAPAAKGEYIINFGLKRQEFVLRLMYVAADDDACLAAWAADAATLAAGVLDVTLGSKALKRCTIEASASGNLDCKDVISSDGALTRVSYMFVVAKFVSHGEAAA
jgi:hypothetical protein